MSSGSSSSCNSGLIVHEINNNNHDAGTGSDEVMDDYFSALFFHTLLISDDRETGAFGKFAPDSDTQIAIEYMLQEARDMEQSYRLAKSLSTCEEVPDDLLEEMSLQDNMTRNDRELTERIERQEPDAENSLRAANARFHLVQPFSSEVVTACLTDAGDINKYESLKHEIENPCRPASELDLAASRVISENGWKLGLFTTA
ncbi:hypothetical protein BGZ47_000413 [Haplosporangium gracile]|nr:hypothetical protein BGZ47_000413 [Haplosporangium gracile]